VSVEVVCVPKVAIAGKNWLQEHFDQFCRWRQECRRGRADVSGGQGQGKSATLEPTSQYVAARRENLHCRWTAAVPRLVVQHFYYNRPIHLRFGLLVSQFIHSSVVTFGPTRSFHLSQLLFSVIIFFCCFVWFRLVVNTDRYPIGFENCQFEFDQSFL